MSKPIDKNYLLIQLKNFKTKILDPLFAKKVDIAQGSENEGKILKVNNEGNLELTENSSSADDKMDKVNPRGTGSFRLGEIGEDDTVGAGSFATGYVNSWISYAVNSSNVIYLTYHIGYTVDDIVNKNFEFSVVRNNETLDNTVTLKITSETLEDDDTKNICEYISGETLQASDTGIYSDLTKISANIASGENAHSEGYMTTASGHSSHAEGYYTTASGYDSHAENSGTTASGHYSHAEGYYTTASGYDSHAEGLETTASGDYAHAEGYKCTASGYDSHAEGFNTAAENKYAHAEGNWTKATGLAAHAEGYSSSASGEYSHAQNRTTIAKGANQTAMGKYNVADTTSALIVGNGTGASTSARSNALKLDWDGNLAIAGDLTDMNGSSLLPTIVTGTLVAGQTELTITNTAITANSIIDIYTSVYGVSPTNVTSAVGSVTITFDTRTDDLNVKVIIFTDSN